MKSETISSKPRTLRGKDLIKAAEIALAEMAKFSSEIEPINILRLANRLNVSRQAIYNNKLDETIKKYKKLQRDNFGTESAAVKKRRSAEERIAELKKRNEQLEKQLDSWIELWATIECNARNHGLNIDLFLIPLKKPLRQTLIFKK